MVGVLGLGFVGRGWRLSDGWGWLVGMEVGLSAWIALHLRFVAEKFANWLKVQVV